MFVLFNIIFSFIWVLLLSLAFEFFRHPSEEEMLRARMTANFAYLAIMLLPSIAAAVRRLHDTGRSG